MSIDELWAKSPRGKDKQGESLLEHTIRTTQISQVISKQLPFSELETTEISRALFLSCALHDVGKIAKGFQESLRPKGSTWGKRHEILSTTIVAQICPDLEIDLLFSILTHHKSIPANDETSERCLPWEQLPFGQNTIWFQMLENLHSNRDLLVKFLGRLNYDLKLQLDLTKLNDDFNKKGIGFSRFWLNRIYQREQAQREERNLRRISLLRGLLISSDHLASAGKEYIPNIPVLSKHTSTVREKELRGNEILPFQELCGKINGSGILKAPTGSGKTLAMLLWAANNQTRNGRLFYTLPYTASINAMYKRLIQMFPDKTVGVLHHKNAAFLFQLYENEHSANAGSYAKSLSDLARELYFPVKVLTPHQILRVALRGKGWELGLAEFPNACFVFDEIHAYDPLIVGLIIASAKWLQSIGAKILFASATLPQFLEEILKEELQIPESNVIKPGPKNAKDRIVCDKKRHKVQVLQGSLISNLDSIIKDIQNNPIKKTLIVCNYVATSQDLCKKLEEHKIHDYILLHARFNSQDRNNVEEKITCDNPPRILVATQAVEVSLDIDYDCCYSEPAPIDALAQRFGRVNRKGERSLAQVTVFEQQSIEASRPIYDSILVTETVTLLKKQEVLSEYDLIKILNMVYKDGYNNVSLKAKYEQGRDHPSIKNFDDNIIAGTYEDWVDTVIEKTDGQIEVLPCKSVGENGEEKDLYEEFRSLQKKHEYIKARMLLVPIRIIQFKIAKRNGTIRWDDIIGEWVTTLKYYTQLGLDLKNQFDNII
ncbi:MAG: CRISPR-associated helicase Cas3' [Bacteroidota bacterium]|nr:CRISPR-associated helicase Cas3' [Bacteroidota bacterium]